MPARKTLPHNTPHWVATGSIIFITICTHARGRNQLANEHTARAIFDSVAFNHQRGVWWPHLFLLMPDHLHALMSFETETGMRGCLRDWKHYISRSVGVEWQRDFFDHRLRNGESFDQKAAYIRANPVRAGLVDQAEDWPYIRESKERITFPQ
jgi:putative transposase